MAALEKIHNEEVRRGIRQGMIITLVGIALNFAGYFLTGLIGTPFRLRSLGTVSATMFGGYLPGMLAGFITNIIFSLDDYTEISYGFLNLMDAILTYNFIQRKLFTKYRKMLCTIPIYAIIPGVCCYVVAIILKVPHDPIHILVLWELIDKIITVHIAYFALKYIPEKLHIQLVSSIYTCPERQRNRIMSIRTKLLLLVTSMCIMLAGSITGISYLQFRDETVNDHIRSGQGAITLMKEKLDPEKIDYYIENGHDAEGYDEILDYFSKLRDVFPDTEYIYVYRMLEDGVVVVFDVDTDDWDGDEPGQLIEYETVLENEKDKFIAGEEVEPTISNDLYGFVLSVYEPVYNSKGEVVCYACVDFSMDVLIKYASTYIIRTMTMFLSFVFLIFALCIKLMERNIIWPVNEMAYCTSTFSYDNEEERQRNVNRLHALKIYTGDEIENLYCAFTKAVEDVMEYVENLREAKSVVHNMEEKVTRISEEATTDALTGVKNKNAYQKMHDQLTGSIENGTAEFAIVMVDLNHLKKINDNHGHEHGDYYIKGACRIICELFKNSPVFRFGGDEFVVVLTGKAYACRDDLLKEIRAVFEDTSTKDAEPWECFSAACGMAVYSRSAGDTVDSVFKRADEDMYENKVKMKAQRTD